MSATGPLTPAGKAVLAGTALVGAAGWYLGYAELRTVAAAGGLALLVAVAWTLPRARLQVTRTVTPDRVMRGSPAAAHLEVTVPGSRRPSPAVAVRDRVAGQPVDADLGRLAPGRAHHARYDLPTGRRGVVPVGPVGSVRTDPLGLARSERRHGNEAELRVQPRVHTVVPLSAGRKRDLEGPTHDGASGSITFHALREYVTGDDLRLIHWRSSARTGTLMVRHQVDPSQPHTTVVLDTHPASYEDGDLFEGAVEAAASVLVASSHRRFPVRLLTGGGLTVSGRASQAVGRTMLDHLTTVDLDDRVPLTELTRRVAGGGRAGGAGGGGDSLVVITGSVAPGGLADVHLLCRRYQTVATVRLRRDEPEGTSWDRGAFDLVAPTGERFAALWNLAA